MTRDGILETVKAEELVRGDLVSLAVGDVVPADFPAGATERQAFGTRHPEHADDEGGDDGLIEEDILEETLQAAVLRRVAS